MSHSTAPPLMPALNEAIASFRHAAQLATLPAERHFIALRLRECEATPTAP